MAAQTDPNGEPRVPLTKERVLRAAVNLADEGGIESLSMRNLGQKLGVEAMSLYNHVTNKDDILNGIVDIVVSEIDAPSSRADWKAAMRQRAISAREVLLRHPWAPRLMASRTKPGPAMLRYFDSTIGLLREAGFSIEMTHHAIHAIGSRALGFTQELFDENTEDLGPDVAAIFVRQMADEYPYITELVGEVSHDDDTTLGGWDDQVEFEFGLDLILDGLERLRDTAEQSAEGSMKGRNTTWRRSSTASTSTGEPTKYSPM